MIESRRSTRICSEMRAPLVSVGIPTFNRPLGLARTLKCMIAQTYHNLEIIVSDNHSSDRRVVEVLRDFSAADPRIRHFRQPRSMPAVENFRFVLGNAIGEYFMWAADDDTWEPQFIERLANMLELSPGKGLAFCNFDALDPSGRKISSYPEFLPLLKEFTSESPVQRLTNFILQEESRGKANLIYGLFRRRDLEAAGGFKIWGLNSWGSDMLAVSAVLATRGVGIDEQLLYHVGPHLVAEKMAGSTWGPANTPPTRLEVFKDAVHRYWGYIFGYVRITRSARSITASGRIKLYGVIAYKFARMILRELRTV
jgi:glycosyltransferase involved in cell wall biosynthesis